MACAALAGCASGQSILQAGNDPLPTTTAPATSATAPGGPPPTIDLTGGGAATPTTIDLTGGGAAVPPTIDLTGGGAAGQGFGPAVPNFAPCPVDALDEADGPVRIVFWHAMTNTLEDALIALTDEYNASQDRVAVELQNQNGYSELIDKYFQTGTGDRPVIAQMPEYMVQQVADTNSVVPIGACIQTEGYDQSSFLPRALLAYQTGGIQWSMPFNVSDPVLYYLRPTFEAAGLDPDSPPISLQDLRDDAQAIVDSGAATYGIALDSGVDSGGGWFLEQWFARMGQPYSDNGNGRLAPSTQVLFDSPEGLDLLTFVQDLVADGLAVTVGDNPSGQDVLLKLADQQQPAAMGIATSAGLGTVLNVLDGGLIPGLTSADVGVGPMPGPSDTPSAIVGGASLYIVAGHPDAETAAAWDYIKFLVSAESQSTWASMTGYVPVRQDALDLEPLAGTYADDPRFLVAYDQLVSGSDDLNAVGPVLGPLRQIREGTAQMMARIYAGDDVGASLEATAAQANLLIIDYASRNQ